MQQLYWDNWKRFLNQRGLTPLICALLEQAGSLMPLVSQIMFLGLPLMKSLSWNNQYQVLIKTLADENSVDHFSHYLREVRG